MRVTKKGELTLDCNFALNRNFAAFHLFYLSFNNLLIIAFNFEHLRNDFESIKTD